MTLNFNDLVDTDEKFIKTLNQMGFMTTDLDDISKKFVDRAIESNLKALEIGAAYGVAASRIALAGGQVTVNDLDQRHLDVLKQKLAKEIALNPHVQFIAGSFPSFLDEMPTQKFDLALIARVLHFFDPEGIIESLKQLNSHLNPQGEIYIVCETPYVKTLTDFIPIYEAKPPGPFRGHVEVATINSEIAKVLPPKMTLFDQETAEHIASQLDMKLIECRYLNRTDFPEWLRLDGRESLGFVVKKK